MYKLITTQKMEKTISFLHIYSIKFKKIKMCGYITLKASISKNLIFQKVFHVLKSILLLDKLKIRKTNIKIDVKSVNNAKNNKTKMYQRRRPMKLKSQMMILAIAIPWRMKLMNKLMLILLMMKMIIRTYLNYKKELVTQNRTLRIQDIAHNE